MEKIFFAYENKEKSGSAINVDAILKAKKILKASNDYTITTWEDLKVNGRILIKSIFEEIDKSDIFACDLTYLNHNVFFELGYAIARNRKLYLLINSSFSDEGNRYSKIDVLKTIGYSSFSNGQDIINNLEKLPDTPKLLEDLKVGPKIKEHDIFYIQSSANSQAELDTLAYLMESSYRLMYDDPEEIEYRKFSWYISSIRNALNVVVHITDDAISGSNVANLKASLFAGISCGMENETLLLAPKEYNPPIDYADILIHYESTNECTDKLSKWLSEHVQKKGKANKKEERELNLLKLGLGYEIAENEKDSLAEYFVKTSAYLKAHEVQRAFFIGRKGTGKTALYLMLSEEFGAAEQTFVINLKPESIELLRNVELTDLYSGVAKKNSFFHSIWKFVIYSKTILSVCDSLLNNKKTYVDETTIESRIIDFCENNEEVLDMHFMETLAYMETQVESNPLERIHKDITTPIANLLKEYLSKHKYAEIVILADNLDKTWNINNDLSVQADMILSLFEVIGVAENELCRRSKSEVKMKAILFLRYDIFKYILNVADEPDKLILYKNDVDWSSFPGKLKQLIEQRFRFVLNSDNIDAVWTDYFDLDNKNKKSVFERLCESCLPRPRDMLMFMRQMFEAAVNNGHDKVKENDYKYALKEYAEFLYQNLIAEMSAEFPNIRSVLDLLHEKYHDRIDFEKLIKDLELVTDSDTVDSLVDALIANEYFILINADTGEKYHDCYKAKKALELSYKKVLFITVRPKTHTVYAKITPQYRGRMEYKDPNQHSQSVSVWKSFWNRLK